MVFPIVPIRLLARLTKVFSRCFLIVIMLSLSSCNQPSDEATESQRLEEYLAKERIERIPEKAFDFPPLVNASVLSSTIVVPRMTDDFLEGKNLVYCATSKLLEMDENQSISGQSKPATSMGTASVLPANSYQFISGTPGEIRSQLAESFPTTAESLDFLEGKEHWSCCHFKRNLPFLEAFEPLSEPLIFQTSKGVFEVASFGDRRFEESSLQQTLRKNQITIIDFNSEDNFIVRLDTKVNEDELILAKVTPQKSLKLTLEGVMQRVKNNPLEGSKLSGIQEGEALVVPMLTVNLLKWFSNSPTRLQTIRFRLDEKGAALDSLLGYLSLHDDVVFRQMLFDKPFLLYLKSKNAESPYFVLWIENPELMETFVAENEGVVISPEAHKNPQTGSGSTE